MREEEFIMRAKVHWVNLLPHIFLMFWYIGFLTVIPVLIRMLTTNLTLTTRHLYGKTGLIKTKSLNTPLNKINDISVSSGFLGKLLGYGTLHITSSSGSYEFKCIKHPEKFRDAVMEEIENYDDYRIQKMISAMNQ